MTNEEYGKIISKNLKRIFYEHEKTQADVSRDLGINKATLSSYMTGTRIPKMNTIDKLCHYFNVSRVDIMEEQRARDQLERLIAYYQRLVPADKDTLERMAKALSENK